MHMFLLFLLFFPLFGFNHAATNLHGDTGTLIVAYDTGENAERIDRVRFLLISEDNDECMYPKGNAFIETCNCHTHVVAIEDLPVGTYRIRFVVPNTDHLFDPIPEVTALVVKDQIVRIDQSIPLHENPKGNPTDVADTIIRRPSGGIIVNQVTSQVSVSTNMPNAGWTLLRYNTPVYNGKGSVTNLQVPDGDSYRIIPEEIDGYVVKINQPSTFPLYPTQTTRISIVYERTYGSLSIQTLSPNNATITAHIASPNKPTVDVQLKPRDGKIHWVSQPMPTGSYEVSYELPANYPPIDPEKFILHNGERRVLNPQLVLKGSLHVTANVPDAIFFLKSVKDSKVWQGSGREFSFLDVPPGTYILSFSTQSPDYYLPPKEMRITLNDVENKEIKATFQIAGRLVLKTNINPSNVTIQEQGGLRKTYQDTVTNNSKAFVLPEGRYRITLSPAQGNTSGENEFLPPDPVEVNIRSLNSTEISIPYKQTVVPSKADVDVKPKEQKPVQANESPAPSMAAIPAGKSIVGAVSSKDGANELPSKIIDISAFSIGVYEVTNAQFAAWLNNAVKAGTIVYIAQDDRRGQVLDTQGRLLFKSFEADPYSQISAQQQTVDGPLFFATGGKDAYPVIDVSWYGATAYCKENNCRLPTEAEWEMAAGMEPASPGEPLKKFIFGFGQDIIDRTWANYKDTYTSIRDFQVLTTPVGFYNGVNTLPLDINQPTTQQTHLAKSPYGAFDMSGNAWEWVSDWYDDAYTTSMTGNDPQGPSSGTTKVVKGGCYDSLADGVRVTERLGLPPDHTDSYTGFRVAK